MKFKYGKTYTVYLKSLKELTKISKKVDFDDSYLIYHSSGRGGGLTISKHRIYEYFGTFKPIDINFFQYSNDGKKRIILKSVEKHILLYDEWIIINHLPNDLFEI